MQRGLKIVLLAP